MKLLLRLLIAGLMVSQLFGWELLCLVGKENDKWLNVEKQVSLRCSSGKLKASAVGVRKVGDMFVYKMPNGEALYCEEDWVWSFRKLVVVGGKNFKSRSCKVYYKR